MRAHRSIQLVAVAALGAAALGSAPPPASASATIPGVVADAAARHKAALKTIGPTPKAMPSRRRASRLGSRWASLRRAANRDLRTLRSLTPASDAETVQKQCASDALARIAKSAGAGSKAYRMLARRRPAAYRRAIKRTKDARRGVAALRRCAGSAAPPPVTSPPVTLPPPPPQVTPTLRIEEFWAIVDVLGPAFPGTGAPGSVITDCFPGANQLTVFFATSNVVPDVPAVAWTLPDGSTAGPFPAEVDDATGRGAANIRRSDDGVLPNGRYTVTASLGPTTLDSDQVTLDCPS